MNRYYMEMSDLRLLALCVWREARGESSEGKRAVAWTIKNRVDHPGWWNNVPEIADASLWKRTILKPWQFSSFNLNDRQHNMFPLDESPVWAECMSVCSGVYMGVDLDDLTHGATHYFDMSIPFPKAWGDRANWDCRLYLGRLKFWKQIQNNHEAVQNAATGEL